MSIQLRVVKCCTDRQGKYHGQSIHDPAVPGDGPWYVQKWVGDSIRSDVGYGTREEALNMLEQALGLLAGENVRVVIDPWD